MCRQGIFRLREYITCVIVCVNIGLISKSVILSYKLTEVVVYVPYLFSVAVKDFSYITVCVVGVGSGCCSTAYCGGMRCYLRCGIVAAILIRIAIAYVAVKLSYKAVKAVVGVSATALLLFYYTIRARRLSIQGAVGF